MTSLCVISIQRFGAPRHQSKADAWAFGEVQLPGFGLYRVRGLRPDGSQPKTVTLTRDATGRYWISFNNQRAPTEMPAPRGRRCFAAKRCLPHSGHIQQKVGQSTGIVHTSSLAHQISVDPALTARRFTHARSRRGGLGVDPEGSSTNICSQRNTRRRATESFRSPTAHREAETAKAHRG